MGRVEEPWLPMVHSYDAYYYYDCLKQLWFSLFLYTEVTLLNSSLLQDQFFVLEVQHNFTRQGLARSTRLITILTAAFGGLAVLCAIVAGALFSFRQ